MSRDTISYVHLLNQVLSSPSLLYSVRLRLELYKLHFPDPMLAGFLFTSANGKF